MGLPRVPARVSPAAGTPDTRGAITIPAGAEGNEQAMQIVDERWYSAEFQTASLQVPADYQIAEGPAIQKLMLHTPAPQAQ